MIENGRMDSIPYDKDKLDGSHEKLSADPLEDISFDAVTLGVMEIEGESVPTTSKELRGVV